MDGDELQCEVHIDDSEDLRPTVDTLAAAHLTARMRAAVTSATKAQLHVEELACAERAEQRRSRRCQEGHQPAAEECSRTLDAGAADPGRQTDDQNSGKQEQMVQRSRPTIKRQREQARIKKQKDRRRRAECARRDPGALSSPTASIRHRRHPPAPAARRLAG